jgi:hypothetical protein
MYIRLEGIFGTALGASATYVYVFILFGAFMIRMGGGDFFINLAQALPGTHTRRRGQGVDLRERIVRDHHRDGAVQCRGRSGW